MASNELSARLLAKYFLLFCFAVLVTSSDADEQNDNGRRVLTVASNNPSQSEEFSTLDNQESESTSAGDAADIPNDGYADGQNVLDIGMEVEVPVIEAEVIDKGGDVNQANNESSGSFFSLENILSVFQPVLEEFNNGKTEEVKTSEKKDVEEAETVPMLQIEAPILTDNMTSDNIPESSENQTAGTDVEKIAKKLKFQCQGKNITENDTAIVKIVNGTELLNMINFKGNENRSDCVLVMFYAPWCHFSAQTAPHYNALGRAYPKLDVLAVDAIHFSNLNARFGTVSVPNILLFHQSRAVVKFNQSTRSFENFVQFVKNLTGLDPNISVALEDQDYLGPLSSEATVETDYLLWLAWVFVCSCSTYMFTVSSTGQHIINRVNVLWQEHQHIE